MWFAVNNTNLKRNLVKGLHSLFSSFTKGQLKPIFKWLVLREFKGLWQSTPLKTEKKFLPSNFLNFSHCLVSLKSNAAALKPV